MFIIKVPTCWLNKRNFVNEWNYLWTNWFYTKIFSKCFDGIFHINKIVFLDHKECVKLLTNNAIFKHFFCLLRCRYKIAYAREWSCSCDEMKIYTLAPTKFFPPLSFCPFFEIFIVRFSSNFIQALSKARCHSNFQSKTLRS